MATPLRTADLAPSTVTAYSLGRIQAPHSPRAPQPRNPRSGPVQTSRLPRELIATAMKLAGGDSGRLSISPDGSILVANHRR